jgi:hypothetical protein
MKQALTVFADIIAEYDVLIDIDDGSFYHFYVRIRLSDGTLLYAREYINVKQARKYAYQWQQADSTLLIRWDNAPHHEQIATYPYHQYSGAEENVQPSAPMTLEAVLSFIQAQLADLQN